MSACTVKCEYQEPGEQIWFSSRFEAEQAISPNDCCLIEEVPDGYDGPRWVEE